ncbi:hypothetical protein Acr_02g0005830 [Actinidia rufa]|uniref:Transmembrane protein n=1 Tax=Actinidia rufa TaxID=165716 RepID=A0A7J0E764_9ERIC|nr:hypothetical protein Acr_02g0005830 [Actinidia rufa]
MQDIKMSYVNSLLGRMTNGSEVSKFTVLEECVEAMKLLVEDAKKCYTEKVDNLNEEMLVVDGCFILELLYSYYLLTHSKEKTNEESKISHLVFSSSLMLNTVLQDLLLLENQLPFCVLEKLFHITVDKILDRPHNYFLFDYVVSYFSNMPMSLEGESTTSNATNCCLSNLDYAGVKFVADTGQDLFQGQCFPGVSCYFTSYAFLMDMLVNSAKDVEVLQKAGIIENYLGADQDASDLFNNLCKEVFVDEFFFTDTFNQATEYSKRCWPATRAHVRRKYFATPWTFIAFCVGLIAFGLSITQFVRSFFT